MKCLWEYVFVIFCFAGRSSEFDPYGLGEGVCRRERRTLVPEVQQYTEKQRCEDWESCWVRTVRKTRTKMVTKTHEDLYCCSGYSHTTPSYPSVVCEPICDHMCINSKCTAPGKCECLPGFGKKTHSHSCEPVCEPACVNSTCVRDNVCQCEIGYSKSSSEPHVCSPHCSNECLNGECTDPEICSCHDEYYKHESNSSICMPFCTLPCVNARCTAPDHCACNEGFVESDSMQNLCEPFCSEGCINGECLAPEMCACYEGYTPQGNASNCIPVCSEACINGECVSPNVCSCLEGFDMGSNDQCCPVCYNCENGECVSPGHCQCNDGYFESMGVCSPFCVFDCINGHCSAPNECTCGNGTLKFGSSHCLLSCTDFPSADICYHSFPFTADSTVLDIDSADPTVQLLQNESIYVPCTHQENTLDLYYRCYTQFLTEDESFISTCLQYEEAESYNLTNHTEWLMNSSSINVGSVRVSLVDRSTAARCSAFICPNSNRILHLNDLSDLHICLEQQPGLSASDDVQPGLMVWLCIALLVALMILATTGMILYYRKYRMSASYSIVDVHAPDNQPIQSNEWECGEIDPEQIAFNQLSIQTE